MRRGLRISAWALAAAALLVVVLVGAVWVMGNTDSGRAVIERLTYRLTGGYVRLSRLGGSFPLHLTLGELQLVDREGAWLTADGIELSWSPLKLLERRIQVDALQVARLHMERAPVSEGTGGTTSLPHIEVGRLSADVVELGAPLTGTAVALSARGTLRLRSLTDAATELVARRLDGAGDYQLQLRFDAKRMDASLIVHEPSSGPLEHILSMPGLGALSATVTLAGPHDAEQVNLALAAGDLHARVQGSVDLTHRSADLDYSLQAPAMAPRPDVAWSALTLQGNWHGALSAPNASGRLDVERLRVAGDTQVARLNASLAASAGKLAVSAVIEGLQIPGPAPRLFAANPVRIEASLQLNDASRPLRLTATHPLFTLREQGATIPDNHGLGAAAELRLPDLAPFAVFTGQDVRGTALVNAHLTHRSGDDTFALDADLGLAGGTASWLRFAGPRVSAKLAGNLSGTTLTIDGMNIAARGLSFAASGSATRAVAPPPGAKAETRNALAKLFKDLQARWQLQVADLAQLSGDVAGELKMSGQLSGPATAFKGDAELRSLLSVRGSPSGPVEATLQVRGLPTTPSGAIEAHGMLDGAPLQVDATLERRPDKAFRILVRRADWKSSHADGDVTADAAFNASRGQLHLRVGQLSDFNRILGLQLSGTLSGDAGFVPVRGHAQAQLELDGTNLAVGQFAGSMHLKAQGVAEALGLQLTAQLPDLYGTPATLASSAVLDLGNDKLHIQSGSLGYRGETVRLLSPADLSFAQGLSVDDLKIGAQEAVAEVQGQLTPALDLRASLGPVKPALVNVFAPGLLAGGSLDARARLRGTLSSPTGRVRIDATAVRFADDAATGLPALDLHARAQLADNAAAVSATLSAGDKSKVTASGTAPLAANGAFDMKIGGKLDVGLANPLLEARGMHAAGELSVDATVTGAAAAPQVGGGIKLAQGSIRDYGRGVNLTDMTAEVVGSEGALAIKSFNAKAVSGTVAMSGTFGILQKGLPLDLTITAKNAQPIASNLITANLDADLHVHGMARERLDVAGVIDVHRATINIPNSLPPDVAVLDVRRRGQTAAADTGQQLVIGLDVTLHAPRQILVEGRGLDAEFGGDLHLNGTTDAPLVSGGLDLVRGTFTLAGNKLSFDPSSKISFDGAGLRKKIDPTLDFTATTTLPSNTTATLRITGVADAPRFDFTSTGGLSPDEILAQLLFGQSASSLTALQVAQIGAALATLSGAGGGGGGFNPLVKLQKSLGLDRLSVGSNTTTTATGATENSGAAIEAGRYVSKRVYVEAKQTTVGTSQVQVQVDLTKHLKLQTRLGNGSAAVQGTTPENDPGSSIGLSYQFEY